MLFYKWVLVLLRAGGGVEAIFTEDSPPLFKKHRFDTELLVLEFPSLFVCLFVLGDVCLFASGVCCLLCCITISSGQWVEPVFTRHVTPFQA